MKLFIQLIQGNYSGFCRIVTIIYLHYYVLSPLLCAVGIIDWEELPENFNRP